MVWLRQGTSPQRLALTLALGVAIGCIPVVGIPTALCATLAVALRLNLTAIQAANYAVMPLQLALIAPFVRMGRWLMVSTHHLPAQPVPLFQGEPLAMAAHLGGLAEQALLAWLLLAVPAVLLLTAALTPVLRRLPVRVENGD